MAKAKNKCLPGVVFAGTIGIILTIVGLITRNFALLTVSMSFILFPIFAKYCWENKLIRIISFIPFVFFAAVFTSIPILMLGIVGVFAAMVPSHH